MAKVIINVENDTILRYLLIKISNFAVVMNKLFHQRFTLSSKCGITLFTLLAFYLFWNKMAIFGACVAVAIVVMIERVIHTTYSFESGEDDDILVIDRGRFSKKVTIVVNEIIKCTRMKTPFGMSHYLLIEYGAGHLVSVQPENEDVFIAELKRRQN